jgi:hypothetical protein
VSRRDPERRIDVLGLAGVGLLGVVAGATSTASSLSSPSDENHSDASERDALNDERTFRGSDSMESSRKRASMSARDGVVFPLARVSRDAHRASDESSARRETA